MTKSKLKAKRRAFAMVLSMSMAMPMTIPGVPAMAAEDEIADAYASEGYELVWNDEFDGDTLNTDDWNVELHDPGWVNSELQRYTSLEEGNIEVKDGVLKIYPKAEEKQKAEGEVDVLNGAGFDGSWTGAVPSEGKATVNISSIGANPWDVQLMKGDLPLIEGHNYRISFKASAAEERDVRVGVVETVNYQGFSAEFSVGPTETEYSYEFPMGVCDPDKGAIQFNLGNLGDGFNSVATTVVFSDIKLIDLSESGSSAELFTGNTFDDSWGGSANSQVVDGKALLTYSSLGVNPWDVQYQKAGLALIEGHEYQISVKAKAGEARDMRIAVVETNNYQGKSWDVDLTTDETEYTFTFTMGVCAENKGAVQFSLGDLGNNKSVITPVELSEVSLIDLTVAAEEGSDEPNVMTDYNYTSGRVNTQNKHDFVYGRFEASIRVPKGMGYLPAFWLMATDEDDYGAWPLCGEIDIMEVMGQDITKSYHTIHYGAPEHAEDQGTLVLDEAVSSFYDDYHTFVLDWEPGSLVWYVDGVQVHEAHDWATGKDEESTLTYPAPFDHDMYVILNLAVGGSWVGYPDLEAVEDMANQSMDIDYVRVYRKDASYYQNLEATCEKPEAEPFREPDASGNYVRNGNFAEDLKPMDSKGDNFELHLESDAEGSTYSISNGELTITPDSVGEKLYSVQLKQNNIPMIRGWEYEVTYDAWADVEAGETRQITCDVKGPDRNWCLYLDEQQVQLTNQKTSYSHKFSIDTANDGNGVLEFNLGAQGTSAPVHISNVTLKHIAGEEITDPDKTVRPDGNYVYNGTFDQGENRLGNWEVFSMLDDVDVSVTNDLIEDGRKRELQVKVVVPQGATELEPVIVYQSDIAPLVKGTYDFSFDAYKVGGDEGDNEGMKALVSNDKKYKPELTDEKQTYDYKIQLDSSLDRENSYVEFIFYRPGTYYLDNVKLVESAMIKNGSFDSGKAGYDFGVYNDGKASYSIADEVDGHDTVLDVDIENIGTADWHVQFKQPGITLEKDKYYKLTFDVKSTVDRIVSVCMQEDGGQWRIYSDEAKKIYNATSTWQTFSEIFQMTNDTDTNVLFSVALGDLGEAVDAHHVYFDNISLIEVDENGDPLASSAISPIDTTGEDYDVLAHGSWKHNSKGWWYDLGNGNYVANNWAYIGGEYYYFDANGYMEADCYRDNCYLTKSGAWDRQAPVIGWKKNSKGWWYGIVGDFFVQNTWRKIDGKWYFFKYDGYMAQNEYVNGYWLNKDGSWTYPYKASWHKSGSKWWYGDTKGWYAKNASYVIDGVKYTFDAQGYMVK